MAERESSEYDVVTIRLHPGTLSLLCAAYPILFGILIDDLPFAFGGRLRPYLGSALLAALGLNAAGIVLGALAARRPESRGAGRLGILVNAIVFVLLALFVLVFRWIRSGQLSWF